MENSENKKKVITVESELRSRIQAKKDSLRQKLVLLEQFETELPKGLSGDFYRFISLNDS
jgi:hypothetical protein